MLILNLSLTAGRLERFNNTWQGDVSSRQECPQLCQTFVLAMKIAACNQLFFIRAVFNHFGDAAHIQVGMKRFAVHLAPTGLRHGHIFHVLQIRTHFELMT